MPIQGPMKESLFFTMITKIAANVPFNLLQVTPNTRPWCHELLEQSTTLFTLTLKLWSFLWFEAPDA